MKINEISIRNPLKQALDSDDVSNILADHGWQLLGVGYEAAVANIPRGVVGPGWCSEVGYLLDVGQGRHLITREEIQQIRFARWLAQEG